MRHDTERDGGAVRATVLFMKGHRFEPCTSQLHTHPAIPLPTHRTLHVLGFFLQFYSFYKSIIVTVSKPKLQNLNVYASAHVCTDLHINTHTRLFLSGLIFILVYFSSSTLYEIFCSPQLFQEMLTPWKKLIRWYYFYLVTDFNNII